MALIQVVYDHVIESHMLIYEKVLSCILHYTLHLLLSC